MAVQSDTLAELDLIHRAKKGDHAAFGMLVERYKDQVYNLVTRTLGNQYQADDVAQEAFIRAWKALSHFEERSKFSSWLYRIAINCAFTELRRSGKPVDQLPPEEMEIVKLPGSGALSAEAAFEKRDLVEKLIKRLSPIYRSIVVLFYLQDMDCQEIAAVLNRPVGTVKAYLHRARTEMRSSAEYLLKTRSGN
ncbi:MAG: sigma-70 family RNA polymerase sigma factor [bacterium]|nr:sigma-70 family RNA polymerase sigma factor [bacterium]